MKKFCVAATLLISAVPAFAKTHSYIYPMPCSALWPAVKDTLRNSGKYGILGIDSTEMTASYNIGGSLGGKRTNSLVLNTKDAASCELQVQTSYSGFTNDDAGDLKKRVDASLTKLGPATIPLSTPDAKPTTVPPSS